MKLKQISKISAIIIVLILIIMNFYGVNFGTFSTLAKRGSYQPYNAFKNYIWGGVGEEENDKYGWNISYIENLNGDEHPDLIISAPWYDSTSHENIGAVYIFFGKANIGFNNLSFSSADAIIIGDSVGHNFGWDIADAGDMNGDEINDIIVGAPGAAANRGRAYIFYGGIIQSGTHTAMDVADRILDSEIIGVSANGLYGSAVSGIGDINNDGYDDVLVGAPGADQTVITYGYKNKVTIYPNIWDDDLTSEGVVRFENGVNNTANDLNTWGLDGDDDGWDWIDSFDDPTNFYGETPGATTDHANIYAPWEADGPDADGLTMSNRTSLEIMIGRNHTDYNPYGLDNDSQYDPGASAGWGIEFNLTAEIYNYLSTNSTITVGFDYGAMDSNRIYNNSNRSRRIISLIQTRIWNGATIDYIGNECQSNLKCVYYKEDPQNTPPWGPIYDSFEWDITDYIDHIGSYYWDFGCYFDRCYKIRADDGLTVFFDNISMKITNDKSVVIVGMKDSGFGTSIAKLGDLNDDGYPDVMIGAPNLDSGYTALVSGKKRFNTTESIGISTIILTGKNLGDRFGYSVSSAGDVDNDGKVDVIIGAPGGDYANLYYGSTLNAPLLVPDLWELDVEKSTPYIEFDAGIKSTENTPGLSGDNDGWDIWNGVYGYQSGETPGSSVTFNGAEEINSPQIAADDELIIYIGGNLGDGGWFEARKDSGAYGVKFSVSQNMITALESGAEMVLSYDMRFKNLGLDQDDSIWIKTFIRNSTGDYPLGWALDKDALDTDNKDDTNETHWAELPEDIRSVFVQECSEYFSSVGSYYLDIGAKIGYYSWENSLFEDGVFHFDNVFLRINPPPDIKFTGPDRSRFGFSVGYSDKLNLDNNGDIIIGAPFYDSPNGIDSGAIYGFLTDPNLGKTLSAENAEFITFGEHPSDYFGQSLLGTENLDADEFNEIVTTAVNYDYQTLSDVGRVYLLSISKGPRIRLLHPLGGENLSGEVRVNATVTDPDENIDDTKGVYFSYSTDPNLVDWTEIGNDITPSGVNNIYEYIWNTSLLPDGTNYYIKAWVQDQELDKGINISSVVTIDNPHQPELLILEPKLNEIIKASVEIKALAKDSDLDIIGGGINITRGVQFYFSKDNESWELLGIADSAVDDIYSTSFNALPYPDGEYWLKVNATDWDGFEVEEIINVTIDNPARPPSIKLLSPIDKLELLDKVIISATAFDFDGDINTSGVTFYLTHQDGPEQWVAIGNDPSPVVNSTGADIYSIEWDTKTVADDWYKLKAFVNDTEGLTNESEISEFMIHNSVTNPPIIELLTPVGGQIVDKTQVITARVRDLEGNIDPNGVFYYYSADKIQWNYIGNMANTRPEDDEYYDFKWFTDQIPDGKYWLNVTVSDTTNLKSWDVIDKPIIIHNYIKNTPVIKILAPTIGQHIEGTFKIRAHASDMEDNIDKNGVTFSFSKDNIDTEDWIVISNVKSPNYGDNIFELPWETVNHPDGKYWLRAQATDKDGLTGEAYSDYFFIHNNLNNPPIVTFLGPHSGEVNGTIKINASVFDIENNLDEDGVSFYYSTDKDTDTWTLIGKDPTPIQKANENVYDFYWDTKSVPDGFYWLKASILDVTELIGFDISDNPIKVHNNVDNPPRIIFIAPLGDDPLTVRESIMVEVIDFDNDVESVSFYYSSDNETWELIDSKIEQLGINYKTIWNTEEIYNGEYYIKVKATDKFGNYDELIKGPFKVTQGIEEESKPAQSWILSYEKLLLFLIIIIIIIIIVVVVLMMRRSKKREKKLIQEVAVEVAESRVLEGEIETTGLVGAEGIGKQAGKPAYQTYIPASEAQVPAVDEEPDVETIEAYKGQVEIWKTEGYNVSRLEQMSSTDESMFARAFPIFSANITKLKNITSELITLDTIDHETQAQSIEGKLKEPDQALAAEREFKDLKIKLGVMASTLGGVEGEGATALSPGPAPAGTVPELPQPKVDVMLPQLMPAPKGATTPQVPTTTTEPVSESEVPPEVELSPELDLPPAEQEGPVVSLPSEPESQPQSQQTQQSTSTSTSTEEIKKDDNEN